MSWLTYLYCFCLHNCSFTLLIISCYKLILLLQKSMFGSLVTGSWRRALNSASESLFVRRSSTKEHVKFRDLESIDGSLVNDQLPCCEAAPRLVISAGPRILWMEPWSCAETAPGRASQSAAGGGTHRRDGRKFEKPSLTTSSIYLL